VQAAAAADNIENGGRADDVELTTYSTSHLDSADSDGAKQTLPVVSCTSDSTDDEQSHAEGVEEPRDVTPNASSLLQADLQESLLDTNNCCDTGLTDSSAGVCLVDKSADDKTDAVEYGIPTDVRETYDVQLSTVAVANDLQSCNELSTSMTDSLDICEQGLMTDSGDTSNQTGPADAGNVMHFGTGGFTLTPCQCGSDTATDVPGNSYAVESKTKLDLEDAEKGSCCHNFSESDLSPTESAQPVNSLDHSAVAREKDLAVSVVGEALIDVASNTPTLPLVNISDDRTSALSSSASIMCSVAVMESKLEPVEACSLTPDGISLLLEADCEHGGKASKLDQVLSSATTTDSLTSSDVEACDTGALHMSAVGCQPTHHSDTGSESDLSRDTSIGVLMVCDDDGLASSVSSISSDFSALVPDSHEDGDGVLSDDGDYESLVVDTPTSFTSNLSDEVLTDKQPSNIIGMVACSDRMDASLTDSCAAVVSSEDVMLCEVESKSHEMRELLADLSQSSVDTSQDAQLPDTSILSHDDSEFRTP